VNLDFTKKKNDTLVGATATTWSPLDRNGFKALLLKYMPVDIFQTAVLTDSFVVANFGSSLSSTAAWRALRCRLSLRMGLK
jgi:hypothetical protein